MISLPETWTHEERERIAAKVGPSLAAPLGDLLEMADVFLRPMNRRSRTRETWADRVAAWVRRENRLLRRGVREPSWWRTDAYMTPADVPAAVVVDLVAARAARAARRGEGEGRP